MTLFQKKLNYLFRTLNIEERKFIESFSEKGHNYSARKKVVINKWLYGEMKKLPKWKYNKYPISREKIDKILVFPESCFLDKENLDIFMERVDNYNLEIVYVENKKFKFDYNYIYYFDRHKKEILEAKFCITQEIDTNKKYKIKITPNSFYFDGGKITEYNGSLSIDNEGDYLISVRNNFETLTGYFIKNRSYNINDKKLYGLMLGRSYNQSFPLCNKNVLSDKQLNKKEKMELYYILNESEDLISDENSEPFYQNNKEKYFNKFYEKVENLKNFTFNSQKILKEEIKDDSYLNILYDTFFSFYEIASHAKSKKRYWVSNKKRAYKKFLQSISERENAICYIVTPIYDSYIYLFDEYSKNLIEHNIKLAKNGLKIEQIFVVSKEYKMNEFIQKMVNKLTSNNIMIKFILFDDIENHISLNSYDFLCSNKDDIALYRNSNAHKYLYNITPSKDKIWELQSDYKKIKKLSHSLDEFLIYQKKETTILEELVGIWYHYYYGSYKNSNGLLKVWSSTLEIFENGVVEYRDEDKVTLKGKLNCEFNKEHPFIYLTALESKSLALLQLDRQDIYRQIFKVPVLDKQLSSTLNMASVGFFSKEKMEESTIRDILGKDTGVLIEDSQMQKRINNYYNQKKFGEE